VVGKVGGFAEAPVPVAHLIEVVLQVGDTSELLVVENLRLTGLSVGIEELFDDYTRKYDYWFGSIAMNMPPNLSDEKSFKWIIQNLAKELYDNKIMQQLLKWELCDENPITRRTATMRESLNQSLIAVLEKRFGGTGLDINVLTALTISGVYYLIMHQEISTFCNVDFSSKKGRKRLDAALDQLISLFFSKMKHQQEIQEIAKRLEEAGVSLEIIAKCIDLK